MSSRVVKTTLGLQGFHGDMIQQQSKVSTSVTLWNNDLCPQLNVESISFFFALDVVLMFVAKLE